MIEQEKRLPLALALLAALLLLFQAVGPSPPNRPPTPAPSPGPTDDTDREIRDLMNRERQARRLAPLEPDAALIAAAAGHAADMAKHDRMSHYGSNGSTWVQRCRAAGYPSDAIGENVAAWQTSPAQVVGDWMTSPGHRRAILGDYRHCGAAVGVSRTGRRYWVVDFGRPGRPVAAMVAKWPRSISTKNPPQVSVMPWDAFARAGAVAAMTPGKKLPSIESLFNIQP